MLLVAPLAALALCAPLIAAEEPGEAPQPPATENPAPPATAAEPVSAPSGMTKEQLLNELEARQAQLALLEAQQGMERAKNTYEETQQLFNEKIVTITALNKDRQSYDEAVLKYERAKIDLDRTRLEFLKGASFITVIDASKYRGTEGAVMASIKLRNDSDFAKALAVMAGATDMNEDRLKALLKIDNVVVTLREPNGAIVGDPFQRIIPELKLGEQTALEFSLLKKEIEEVAVSVEVLGVQKEYTVYLKKEAEEDLPTITASPYAQQGQLGTKVVYSLELERLAKAEQSFSLMVLNMPQELPFAFLDPRNSARVTQVKFTGREPTQTLNLEVSIPEKLAQSFIDSSIGFTVVVMRRQEMEQLYALTKKYAGKTVPAEELAKLKGDKADLILIPKGVGKLEILVANLFKEVQQGQEIAFKFSVMNAGTLALRRVSPMVDPALEWEAKVLPKEIEVIEPGEKVLVSSELIPPEGISIGEYVMKIKAEAHSGVETIEAPDKDFTVRIAAKSNITGTIVLVAVLVVLVLGIAVASIKISRR